MTEPLVSVKMITYNHASYIAQAIEGVLRQKTAFPFELVIGEDCSTDGTRQIVFEYQEKYPDVIRVIASNKNVGMNPNGYRTMKACRGKYIAFCEGDDYWHSPDKLQKQADHMESHPECGLVYSDFDVYQVKSKKRISDFVQYRKWETPENPGIVDFILGKTYAIRTCTVMIRRDLYEQIIESDPCLHQSDRFPRGDTQLWAEISAVSRLHYIPESLATYNETEESATRSKDITKMERLKIADLELLHYLCNKYNVPFNVRNEMEATWCNHSLWFAFHRRSAKLAAEVRNRQRSFTWKEWLRYCASRNLAFYFVCRMAYVARDFFRNKG